MTELTEAEIERLCDWYENETPDWGLPTLLPIVAALIDARLAPIRAALDSWDMGSSRYHTMRAIDADLRAALSAHESAPQAGDGAGSREDGERVGERHAYNPRSRWTGRPDFPRWARCRCGWESRTSRTTWRQAEADYCDHIEEIL